MIQNLIEVARLAGNVLRDGYGKAQSIEEKGRASDLVTATDKASEIVVRQYLARQFPTHAILGEEEGLSGAADAEWTWIVDPLDGTTSFAHGLPFFSTCIALRHRGEIVAGAVYEPLRDEMFVAEQGSGAALNGSPIRVTSTSDLSRALLATGFPYRIAENPNKTLEVFAAVVPHARGIRRMGSAGLDLAYVACGRMDGYWETLLQPWDCAAGALLVREAGGHVTDFGGKSHDIFGLETLATNGAVHEVLMERIRTGQGWDFKLS